MKKKVEKLNEGANLDFFSCNSIIWVVIITIPLSTYEYLTYLHLIIEYHPALWFGFCVKPSVYIITINLRSIDA